ncbi:MAG: ATPase, T2SS/T4P/T4SS family [Pseudomonadales bacterium]
MSAVQPGLEQEPSVAPRSRVLHSNHGTFSSLTPIEQLQGETLLQSLKDGVTQCLQGGELTLAVNLSKSKNANSAMLTTLADCAAAVRQAGGTLRLVHVGALVAKAIALTRLDEQLVVIDDDAARNLEEKRSLTPQHRKLGDILLEQGLLTQAQLDEALAMQTATGKKLGELVIERGWVTDQDVLRALSEQLSIPAVTLKPGLFDPQTAGLLPKKVARRLGVLPLFQVHDQLTIATHNPQNAPKLREVEDRTGLKVLPVFADEAAVLAVIDQSEESLELSSELAAEVDEDFHVYEDATEDLAAIDEVASGSPVINLANSLIQRAVREGASDIHIEPFRDKSRVRFRIDGVLYEIAKHRPELHAALISRLKVMANLDIAERRLPQDGRIQVFTQGRSVDLRLSTLPGLYGEKVVLRVLDRQAAILDIDRLGMSPNNLATYRSLLTNGHGLILVTGPTGSGKTTSLYAALDHLNSLERNIVTIEDPVEYQMDIVNQNEVRSKIGLSFAKILKHVLRQDPDVIMVGEIRERETAEIAVQAALTGHLVLSTLHTNDSPGAITRMIDMGIEPYLLSSALIGVVAQRLVRTICPACKTTYVAPTAVQEQFAAISDEPNLRLARGRGCAECYDSGYRNRIAIHETLPADDALQRLIVSNPTRDELSGHLQSSGFESIFHDGLRRAKEQVTTIEEVSRVINV